MARLIGTYPATTARATRATATIESVASIRSGIFAMSVTGKSLSIFCTSLRMALATLAVLRELLTIRFAPQKRAWSGGRSCQKHVGHIDAGDQEHQAYGAKQHPERLSCVSHNLLLQRYKTDRPAFVLTSELANPTFRQKLDRRSTFPVLGQFHIWHDFRGVFRE